MLRNAHPIAGLIGLAIILANWLSTVVSELTASASEITAVKEAIPWGFIVLVPALAITGASGFWLAGSSTDPRVVSKKRRMPLLAGNGLFILIPAAFYLASLASRGDFENKFYIVRALELVAGAVNITLMSLNARDGFRMTGRFVNNPTPAE
jgi:hypothetical protein